MVFAIKFLRILFEVYNDKVYLLKGIEILTLYDIDMLRAILLRSLLT